MSVNNLKMIQRTKIELLAWEDRATEKFWGQEWVKYCNILDKNFHLLLLFSFTIWYIFFPEWIFCAFLLFFHKYLFFSYSVSHSYSSPVSHQKSWNQRFLGFLGFHEEQLKSIFVWRCNNLSLCYDFLMKNPKLNRRLSWNYKVEHICITTVKLGLVK